MFVMYGKVRSACVSGIEGRMIEVEIDLSNGLPQTHIVGLPDSAVRESMDRVRAAIKNCGFRFPLERITVNLAPADLRKEGSAFDLAIAAGILATSGQIRIDQPEATLLIGELALDGSLREVPGVLSMVHSAAQHGILTVILPEENANEARLAGGLKVIPLRHLRNLDQTKADLVNHVNDLNHSSFHSKPSTAASWPIPPSFHDDFGDVRGQHQAKRGLTIAAAGMHNIVLIGPPGSGKTMLMRRLPSILPDLTLEESLEVTKIYSVANQLPDRSRLMRQRPFRAPHHTISPAGLVGGGSTPRPGESSLAHRGVLFLDEMPEFHRNVLEALRQPLEDRQVTISRARMALRFPSHFILTASMNPCPCGYLGADTPERPCVCSPVQVERYRARISGPLWDRIDLHLEVPRVNYRELLPHHAGDPGVLSSGEMRRTVAKARKIQEQRYSGEPIECNGELSASLMRKYCRLEKEAEDLLHKSFEALGLSVRARDRIVKMSRTIADIEGSEPILTEHLAEALQYRNLDRKWML